MNFDKALEHILEYEGGLVDHPNDPGGLTNFGISLRAFPQLGRDGIRNLTKQSAGVIYRTNYWDNCRVDELPEELKLMVFDCSVNQGSSFARKTLQSAVNVTVDGIIGPKTLEAVSEAPVDAVLHNYSKLRYYRYRYNKNWETFGDGWMNRLLSVLVHTKE